MKLIAYIRVSTERQSEEGHSLEVQEAIIRSYCQTYGHEIVRLFIEAGRSASNLMRKELSDALVALETTEAEGLIVFKLDRLTRSIVDWESLLKRYFDDDKPYAMLSVKEHIDTSTANGRMFLKLVILFAEWEREQLSERIRDVHTKRKSSGFKVGKHPYGYTSDPDTKLLYPLEEEQEVLRIMNDLRAQGASWRGIARHLNDNGILNRKKRPWNHSNVQLCFKEPHDDTE